MKSGSTQFIKGWSRVRRSDLRHLLRVAIRRIQRALPRRAILDTRWDAPLPDLSPVRELAHCPADAEPVIRAADAACRGRFTLLGLPTFELGTPPDWHTDPSSGYRWEAAAQPGTLDLMTRDSPADVRVLWELNRFHHAAVLGMAYRLTGDKSYAASFVSHVSDWLTANRTGYGVNWACAMEVAIRAVNWLYACALTREALPERFVRDLLSALLTHGRFVRHHLEFSLITTNHYLADLCGLAVLGLALPGRLPAAWMKFALREMGRELSFQVHADGVDFEASTGYHRLATELFEVPLRLAGTQGKRVPSILRGRLPLMKDYLASITRPDGSWPAIGDSDDGRVLPLGTCESLPSGSGTASRAFSAAGVYVMRQAQDHLVCDCGSNGQRGLGGHAHNDTLSFELYAGRPVIVDPGTYTYTGSLSDYSWFRSTAAHNTLVIDGEEQARFDPREPFLLAPDAHPRVNRWLATRDYDLLDAEHAGYERLPLPVTHRRQILFDKRRRTWLIRDIITGHGVHRLDWYFHFDSRLASVDAAPPATVVASSRSDGGLVLALLVGPTPRLTLEDGWVSSRYGSRARAAVARYSLLEARLPVTVTFALVAAAEPLRSEDAITLARQSLSVLEAQA